MITIKKVICFLMLFSIVFSNSCGRNNEILERLTKEVERSLSIQYKYKLHDYPMNVNIPIRIVKDVEGKQYYVLVDYDDNINISKKEIYIFEFKYGMFNAERQCQFEKFNDNTIKEKLQSEFQNGEILLSEEKANSKQQLTDEEIKENQIILNEIFDSVRRYFNGSSELMNKYGEDLSLELTVDPNGLLLYSDFFKH